jgi:hypothetical protein
MVPFNMYRFVYNLIEVRSISIHNKNDDQVGQQRRPFSWTSLFTISYVFIVGCISITTLIFIVDNKGRGPTGRAGRATEPERPRNREKAVGFVRDFIVATVATSISRVATFVKTSRPTAPNGPHIKRINGP